MVSGGDHHVGEVLTAAGSLYVQLGSHAHHAWRDPDCARCAASTATGRRTQPASRPPGDLVVVSHMHEIELFVPRWNVAAAWLLDPHLGARIDLTAQLGVTCPVLLGSDGECAGRLVAWPNLRPQGVVRCMHCLAEWQGRAGVNETEWHRLGVVLGVHADGRRGPRLSEVAPT
jgi:hypothetical protein